MHYSHENYLQRCVDLANLATSATSPNPRVGAVLVHENRIIGEGYFQQVGQAHAEVNCLKNVRKEDRKLIAASTLYVSLEPCCFHGRTPACTGLILENKIPKVVIGQLDKTAKVSGQGVAILEEKGVEVLRFPDFIPTKQVAMPRQVFTAQNRPYVLLKFARSADHFLAPSGKGKYWITGSVSKRLVHFWRSRTSAILIGAGTLLKDDPLLTTRLYPGQSPSVCIMDLGNKIGNHSFKLLAQKETREFILIQPEGSPTIKGFQQVFIPLKLANTILAANLSELQILESQLIGSSNVAKKAAEVLNILFATLVSKDINHITVEGGSWLLNLFLCADKWDEARVFTGTTTYFTSGLPAPVVPGPPVETVRLVDDRIDRWYRQ